MYEKTLEGGKMVAKGSFGCVYDPPLLCNDENERPQGYVAKILRKNDAESELREQAMIDKLDSEHNYHLKIRRMCVPEKADVANDKRLKDCELHKEKLTMINEMPKLQRDYRLLHIENGGKSLGDYLKGKRGFLRGEIDTMLFDFTRIVFGLNEMTQNKIGHFDIKPDNMVYNDKNNRFNYIDFGFLSTFDDFVKLFKNWGLRYWVFPIERVFLNSTDPAIQLKIFSNLYELAKSPTSYEETAQQPRYYGHVSSIKSFLADNLRNSSYRPTYRNQHNVVTEKDYCVYGFNKIKQPSEEMLIKEYVEFMKTLMRDMGIDDKSTLIKKFNEENMRKLNVFSIGLVMNTMIHAFLKPRKLKIFLYGEKNIQKTSNKLAKLSPHLAAFYRVMVKVCYPSFPKRISSDEFYAMYLREVYIPIKSEYGFVDLKFMASAPAPVPTPKSQPAEVRVSSSSTTPVPTPNPQPVEVRDENSTAVQQLTQELTRKVRKIKIKKRKASSEHTRKSPLRRKECPPGKILNPKTNRCIGETSALAKKLRKDGVLKKSSSSSSSLPRVNITQKHKKSSPKPHNVTKKNKECPPDKILNPKTNRCIDRNGAMAKKLHKDGVL